MKFRVLRTFLVKAEEEIDLRPEDFLHCATIEELNDDILETLENYGEHPYVKGFQSSEEIGLNYWNNWFEHGEQSFYQKWQELKGLPQEL